MMALDLSAAPFLQHNAPPIFTSETTPNEVSDSNDGGRPSDSDIQASQMNTSFEEDIVQKASGGFSYKKELELLALSYGKVAQMIAKLQEDIFKLRQELHNVEKFVLKQDDEKRIDQDKNVKPNTGNKPGK